MGHRAMDFKSAGLRLKLATTRPQKLFVSSQLCLKKIYDCFAFLSFLTFYVHLNYLLVTFVRHY